MVTWIVLHIDLVAKLSLSIHVLFSIKINLFEVFVDLWLTTESVHGVVRGHFIFICNLVTNKFIDS